MLSEILAIAKGVGGDETGARFLDRLAGPAADEVGLMLQERMRLVRLKNSFRWSKRAKEMAEAAGFSEGANVPLRTLFPLLEGASLEEEETLGEMWAALLANAACGERDAIPPSFPAILRELSPADGLVFSLMQPPHRSLTVEGAATLLHRDPLDLLGRWAILLSLHNLQRLGLAVGEKEDFGVVADDTREGATISKRWYPDSGESARYRLTVLGEAFLEACSPPESTV